jgi:signal transduction histidine kinase
MSLLRRAGWERGSSGGAGHYVWAPIALVVLALLTSVVTPLLLRERERAINRELQEVLNPARALLAQKRAAFERGISSRAAYEISGNPTFQARGAEWKKRERVATAALPPLISQLGPRPRAAWARAQRIEFRIDSAGSQTDASEPTRAEQFDLLPVADERVDSLLAALDQVDAELVREVSFRQDRLDVVIFRSWVVSAALGVLGLAAVLSVAMLTRREQRARAVAEAAVRSRDEVVSIVSHDLRNPLSTVTMATGFLLETIPRVDTRAAERRQLEIVRRAAESMDHMIQDLLDIARIETGRLAVETAPICVADLVQEAVGMLEPIAEKQGKRLVSTVQEGLPAVNADRERMLQIFSNLVGNAVKFTPAGGTITLAAERDADVVRFHVSDTGTGIPPEHLPHLFDRFWQANRTDRRGIGLGLPIVKGLVEAHGGEIRVVSEPGRGTTFSFTVRTV